MPDALMPPLDVGARDAGIGGDVDMISPAPSAEGQHLVAAPARRHDVETRITGRVHAGRLHSADERGAVRRRRRRRDIVRPREVVRDVEAPGRSGEIAAG
jgi:hypothetical protein